MPDKKNQSIFRRVNSDFNKFWFGQAISNFGSAFTRFALPLLIFNLTGSSLNLAITVVTSTLPYLLFGFIIGTFVDRVNRKRMMIFTDIARAFVIASIPLLSLFHILPFWWIYIVGFINSTLSIGFEAGQFTSIPHLVDHDNLVMANGRIQASYSTAKILGPLLGGLLLIIMPVPLLLLFDALSYLISSGSLILIKTSFNESLEERKQGTNIRQDLQEGLRYIWTDPLIRNVILMIALVNFVGVTVSSQLVLFAKQWLAVSNSLVVLLYAAGSIGVVMFSLMVSFIRTRWSYSKVTRGALILEGFSIIVLTVSHQYLLAVLLWAFYSGVSTIFDVSTYSWMQATVPDAILGRVISFGRVLAWSTAPLGALLGGFVIEQTGNIALTYGIIGGIILLIPIAFSFTSLGLSEKS